MLLAKDGSNYVARNTPLPNSNDLCLHDFALIHPEEVKSAREKVLYALWHVGELPYYEILLYADLDNNDAKFVLRNLVNANTIEVTSATSKSDALSHENIAGASFRLK